MSKYIKLKKSVTVVLVVAAILAFAACGASFEFDKEAAVQKAKEIVDRINERDYQAVFDMMNDEMQSLLPAEDLKKAFDPLLDEAGGFKAYSGAQSSGVTQDGVDYIVVVVSAKYENATRIYTISLTADKMLIGGLYMK